MASQSPTALQSQDSTRKVLLKNNKVQFSLNQQTTTVNSIHHMVVMKEDGNQKWCLQFNLGDISQSSDRNWTSPHHTVVIWNKEGYLGITANGLLQVSNATIPDFRRKFQLPQIGDTKTEVKFWKFATDNMIVFCTRSTVYMWYFKEAEVSPAALFAIDDSIQSKSDSLNVVDIQASEDAQWFAVVASGSSSTVVQLYSTVRAHSSVIPGATAVAIFQLAKFGPIMAMTNQHGANYRLIIAGLTADQSAKNVFPRQVLSLPQVESNLPSRDASKDSHPVSILIGGESKSVIAVVLRNGVVFQYRLKSTNNEYSSTPTYHALGEAPVFGGFGSSTEFSVISESSSSVIYTPIAKDTSYETGIAGTSWPVLPGFSASPLQSFITSTYNADVWNLYQNDKSKFFPWFIENKQKMDWARILELDNDLSLALKLAFCVTVAQFKLASRSEIYQYTINNNWIKTSSDKAHFLVQLLGDSDEKADADLQTEALELNMEPFPGVVTEVLTKQPRKWNHFDASKLSQKARQLKLRDLEWILMERADYSSRLAMCLLPDCTIHGSSILTWFNTLPTDQMIDFLQKSYNNKVMPLTWERVTAPFRDGKATDRLPEQYDLAISPPFQKLRTKMSINDPNDRWVQYIQLLIDYGESREICRLLNAYSTHSIGQLVEKAIREAIASKTTPEEKTKLIASLGVLPIVEMFDRQPKIQEQLDDLVTLIVGCTPEYAKHILISISCGVNSSLAPRVIAVLTKKGLETLAQSIIQACCLQLDIPFDIHLVYLCAKQLEVADKILHYASALAETGALAGNQRIISLRDRISERLNPPQSLF